MNIKQMTGYEKTLLIANDMFGEENVFTVGDSKVLYGGWFPFNPYQSGDDALAVVKHYEISIVHTSSGWECLDKYEIISEFHPKLESAISDCAVKVILSKEG